MSASEALLDSSPDWANDDAWRRKLESDANRLERFLPPALSALHEELVRRARSAGVAALILSGSTARGRRTAISDLDYHLVGARVRTNDLSLELDVHFLSQPQLESELLAGDDFVQWSLRFGCIVFDDGAVRRALRLMAERQPWPNVERKRSHAAKSLELAHRFVATGDQEGALVQVRTALSLAARARLLSAGVFPLSRAELPAQLRELGLASGAADLAKAIYDSPSLSELADAARRGERLLEGAREVAPVDGEDDRASTPLP